MQVNRQVGLILVLCAFVVGCGCNGLYEAQAAYGRGVESAMEQLIQSLDQGDPAQLEQLVLGGVRIVGLSELLDQAYRTWYARSKERDEMFAAVMADDLQGLYYEYLNQYFPGMDPLTFLLEFEAYDPEWDHLEEQWVDIWYRLVQDYGDEWAEEYGTDFDVDELEQIFFEMFMASLAWEEEDDWDYEESISEGELALLQSVAELLEKHRTDGRADGFVVSALPLYRAYVLSYEVWGYELIFALSDHFWVYSDEMKLTSTRELVIPGYLAANLLLEEGLSWEEPPELSWRGNTAGLAVTSGFSGATGLLQVSWKQEGDGWQVEALNADWAGQLRWIIEDTMDWLGY